MTLCIKRTARKQGSIGLGLRYLLPVPVITGATTKALQSEVQADLILWRVRLQFIGRSYHTNSHLQ